MLDSCGPLSPVADGLADVGGAGDDVAGIDAVDADGAAEQPVIRTAAAAATANRSEEEKRNLTSLAER